MTEEKESRPGWEWNKAGFWVKTKGPAHQHKKKWSCPHCTKITGTIDDDCIEKNGVCRECMVLYVEDRTKPLIDLSKYRKT